MIKYFKFIFIFNVIFLSFSSQAQIHKITYEIIAGNLSLDAVDSYPQELISYQRSDSLKKVVVRTFAAYNNTAKRETAERDRYTRDKIYPENIRKYLEPTRLTNYNHPEIINAADSIVNMGDSLTLKLINHCLKYVSERIEYDNELAMELDGGKCTTLPVKEILERGKGTCSEYTNLFIALMRRLDIPCRMAVGYIYMPDRNFEGSHAWAECYIDDYGWLAVDPQNGFSWYPPVAVKLFHGKDFIDCDIKTLPDMYPVTIKILNTGQ